jgi:threonine synthase
MPTESQLYLSTRGGSNSFSFRAAVLKGLASDGGLFIPHSIPQLPKDALSKWSNLPFQSLALEILSLYISPDEIPREDLKELIDKSYSSFRVDEITPLVELIGEEKLYLLELFHGPTYAFKDVALQFLGNLFEYFLQKENEGKTGKERDHLTVLGATSGDTGRYTLNVIHANRSAAIYGLRGKKDVDVFILHPHKRISPIQEAQMTTVLDKNVHNLAVNGTFDDCQVSPKITMLSIGYCQRNLLRRHI